MVGDRSSGGADLPETCKSKLWLFAVALKMAGPAAVNMATPAINRMVVMGRISRPPSRRTTRRLPSIKPGKGFAWTTKS